MHDNLRLKFYACLYLCWARAWHGINKERVRDRDEDEIAKK